jgi:nitroreductase
MSAEFPRKADHPVDPQFLTRWSRRSFTGEAVPVADLLTMFEAARWAPSSLNLQPWRFLYAVAGTPDFDLFLEQLMPFNQMWAKKAGALICLVSYSKMEWQGQVITSETHGFDAGAAWGSLALQAHMLGYSSHAMGGFFRDKARVALKVPADYELQAFIAVGKPGKVEDLPADFQPREMPNQRKKLEELAFEGAFSG